ncbi:MAG: hypothetical protein LBE20_02810 [Deltaproteobacteria bacterium]|jgi:hypothetical protein|nr:hypothetical protein [Deltaproteobacteria bacterium]
MKNFVRFFLISSFVILCSLSLAFAQATKPTYGRTPDGSAYRIAKDGTILMDQVAELELTVNELRNDLIETQNELNEKTKLVQTLQKKIASQSSTEQVPYYSSTNLCAKEKSELARLKQELVKLKDELKITKSSLAFIQHQRDNETQNNDFLWGAEPNRAVKTKASGSLNPSAEAGLTKSITRVEALSSKRDKLLEKLTKAGKTFEVKELVATSGNDFENLKTRTVSSKKSLDEVELISQDLSEIENILKEDISFLRRMLK